MSPVGNGPFARYLCIPGGDGDGHIVYKLGVALPGCGRNGSIFRSRPEKYLPTKLEAVHRHKSFVRRSEELEVLRDISLTVDEGEFVSFVGASGCGKTTLLRVMHGLIPPTSGKVVVGGAEVQGPSTDRGFVLQQDSLLPWSTVLGNVMFGLEVQGKGGKEARAKALDLLRLVGLEGFENHYPLEISGGMRQRVNLARALAV